MHVITHKSICYISNPRFCCTLMSALAEKNTNSGKAYPVERSHTELCSKERNSCIIWFQTYTFLQDFNSSSRLLKTFFIEITKSITMFHRHKIPISIIVFFFSCMWRNQYQTFCRKCVTTHASETHDCNHCWFFPIWNMIKRSRRKICSECNFNGYTEKFARPVSSQHFNKANERARMQAVIWTSCVSVLFGS